MQPPEKDQIPSPESPGGNIKIEVPQPELLYNWLVKPSLRTGGVKESVLIGKVQSEPLLNNRMDIQLNKHSGGGGPSNYDYYTYDYSTSLHPPYRDHRKSDDLFQPTYAPERTAKVVENLRAQGLLLNKYRHNNPRGEQIIEVYNPSGLSGVQVQVNMGWPSRQVFLDFLERIAPDNVEPTPDGKRDLQPWIDNQMYWFRSGIDIRLRSVLGNHEVVPIPATQAEFLHQTEFYRKTLEQVLRALYDEAQITPNIDMTLGLPIDKPSEDKSSNTDIPDVFRKTWKDDDKDW